MERLSIPFDEYCNISKLNCSKLKYFLPGSSPRKSLVETEPTAAMKEGRMFHEMMEGSDVYFIVSPYADFRTKESREWRKEHEAKGHFVVKEDDYGRLCDMRGSIISTCERVGLDIESNAEDEVTFSTIDEKCRIDRMTSTTNEINIIDWKTCMNASSRSVNSIIENLHYDMQAYMYTSIVESVIQSGDWIRFYFVFIEKVAPFDCTVVEVGDETLASGGQKYLAAKERYMKCIGKELPSYEDSIITSMPPAWRLKELEETTNTFLDGE